MSDPYQLSEQNFGHLRKEILAELKRWSRLNLPQLHHSSQNVYFARFLDAFQVIPIPALVASFKHCQKLLNSLCPRKRDGG